MAPYTPELEKFRATHHDRLTLVDFLSWLNELGVLLDFESMDKASRYFPTFDSRRREDVLDKYFGIDRKKMEKERRELLEYQRSLNEQK